MVSERGEGVGKLFQNGRELVWKTGTLGWDHSDPVSKPGNCGGFRSRSGSSKTRPGIAKRGRRLPCRRPGDGGLRLEKLASEQAEDGLRSLVGLGEDGHAGLLQNLPLGEVGHLGGDVGVPDGRFGGGEALSGNSQGPDIGLQDIPLEAADLAAGLGDLLDGGVDDLHGVVSPAGGSHVEIAEIESRDDSGAELAGGEVAERKVGGLPGIGADLELAAADGDLADGGVLDRGGDVSGGRQVDGIAVCVAEREPAVSILAGCEEGRGRSDLDRGEGVDSRGGCGPCAADSDNAAGVGEVDSGVGAVCAGAEDEVSAVVGCEYAGLTLGGIDLLDDFLDGGACAGCEGDSVDGEGPGGDGGSEGGGDSGDGGLGSGLGEGGYDGGVAGDCGSGELSTQVDGADEVSGDGIGADSGASIEQSLGAELGLLGDAGDGLGDGLELSLVCLDGGLAHRAGIGAGDGEAPSVAEQSVDLIERAFCGLGVVDGVLAIAERGVQPVELGSKTFGNDQAGGIVGGGIDPQTGRESSDRLIEIGAGLANVAQRVHSCDIGIDSK